MNFRTIFKVTFLKMQGKPFSMLNLAVISLLQFSVFMALLSRNLDIRREINI